MILYGLPNCNTVKKARVWLDTHQIPYLFHDFKKQGVSADLLHRWIDRNGWEALLNKRGTTWRQLSAQQQAKINNTEQAVGAMLQYPALIKRPILETAEAIHVGFDPAVYQVLTA